MKSNFLRSFFIIKILFICTLAAQAQRGSPSVAAARPSSSVKYRLLANYDYIMTSPSDLNNHRSTFQWNNTTTTIGTFSNMNGFSLGAGYLIGNGFVGLEFARGVQDLTNTLIVPGTFSVQDSLNYDTVYALYDWVFNRGANQSYELGLGIGQTLKFQYHNILTSGSTTEDLIWQATPMVFKIRANYNYHFSNNFRLRVGATYENATSSTLKANANHPTITVNGSPVVSGQNLRTASGQDVKVDISGLRLNVGAVVAF